MAVNIAAPFIHVEDSNGLPYVGAKLHVYQVGTTTLASIFSDAALSVAVTNPLAGANASDAAGNFPRVYIAAGTYKLRAETSTGTLIWQFDEIDTGLASGGVLSIASGGTNAATAAAARTNLGAAAQTDVDDLADDISTINATLVNITALPQGYLTPTAGTPVIASSVSAGTAVYYTPFVGNLCPIYNGTSMVVTQFAELTLTLNSNHLANAIYDCFVINDGGTVRLVTGPAWNTATAGAGARGTGAGTTELTRTSGIWTNANSMTARYGATTVAVDANEGTYIGSLHMDGTNGQISCLIAYGQSRKFGVWNAYNRQTRILKCGDATASWAYNTTTIRASNGSSANSITVFSGLAEEAYSLEFTQIVEPANDGATSTCLNYIGYNSTTAGSGFAGRFTQNTANLFGNIIAQHSALPSLGIQVITALENVGAAGGATNQQFLGTEANMLLTAEWRG